MASVGVIGECVCGGSSAEPNFDCERCRLVWFVLQVKEMRIAQRAYFKERDKPTLDRAMKAERTVDGALTKLTRNQGDLFDDDGP